MGRQARYSTSPAREAAARLEVANPGLRRPAGCTAALGGTAQAHSRREDQRRQEAQEVVRMGRPGDGNRPAGRSVRMH
jgi:hypothetical protein